LYNLKLESESEENYESNYENNKRKIQKLKSINQLAFHNNSSPQRGYGTRRKFTTPSGEHEVNTYIVDANFPSMLDYPCDKGRWFTENDLQNKWTAIVLSPGAAEKFFGINECLNKVLTNPDGGKFKIVGIAGGRTLRRGSWDREKIFLQNKTPQYEILITPEKGFVISQICEEIDKNLSFASIERTRSIAETYHSNYKENQLPYIKFGIAIILIMLLNAGVGFFAVGWGQVRKRLAEIGIRRASGASAKNIQQMILWESTKTTLLGIGIALILLSQLILLTGNELFHTYIWIYACIVAFVITLGFMLISTLAPARRAARIQPVEALSEE
jgi:putative ABC transport system permease protein